MSITFAEQLNYHQLYQVSLDDVVFTVTVTGSALIARRWVTDMLSDPRNSSSLNDGTMVVGLSIRWSPNSQRRNLVPSTLQLCVGDQCLIFQLCLSSTVPRNLRGFLQDPNCTFVGFWNLYHRHLLSISEEEVMLGSDPLDLRTFLNDDQLANSSLENIVQACLGIQGVRTTRLVDMSDWGAVTLSDDQLLQASLEVRCAYLIGHNYHAWNRG